MKKILPLVLLCCFISLAISAQKIPSGIPFQGIAKDFNGAPANERNIYIQTSLLSGTINGKSFFTEVHEINTDALGVFSIMIGNGKKTAGIISSLNEINWEDGPFYLNVQIAIPPNAPIQNWMYQDHWNNMGTTSLGIVPYAFYAIQTSGLQAKLNASDTALMLKNYVNQQVLQYLDSAIRSKLSAKDTLGMLAPYVKTTSYDTSSKIQNQSTTLNSFSGHYDDLTGKPNLFDGDYSSLTNKPLLFNREYDSLKNKPNLFSGIYDSLKNKPNLFSGIYDSLKNKPNLFDGDYLSLSNKPNLFSGAYIDLTGKPNLFDGDYTTLLNKPSLFSGDYNDLSNKPVLSLTGDITNNGNITNLINSGVNSGTYGSGLAIPIISVDEKGRITSASTTTISPYSFPNKTNAEKNAMTSITTGTVIWCSNCGIRGQMQVYNGYEWTDLTGGAALNNNISFGTISSSNISSSTASITTTINSDGGTSISARGIVWNTNINPTIALSTKTSSGSGIGTFSESITGLSASTTFYIRTYATNTNGTVYGNEISFTTSGISPSLNTNSASSISINSFTTGGNITNDGGNAVTYRGICWSNTSNPTINDNKILSGTGTGTYTITLSNLNANTNYYVRSFATNSAGTSYGNEIMVTTSALTAGTNYLGGRIAYIFQSGDVGYIAGEIHGFIIMNHGMGMRVPYGEYNTISNTSINFGTGLNNTLKLKNMTGTNAAKYIYNILYDGYNDWYIPSYFEWNKIATNWRLLGIPAGNYQSSSETDPYSSYYLVASATSASITGSTKSSLYEIIGIRNF